MKKFGVAATIACVLVASAPGAVVAVNPGDFVSPVFLTLGNSGQVNPPNAYTEAGVSITSPNPFYVYTEGETGLNIIDLYAQVNSEVSLNLSFTDTVLRFGFEAGDLGTTIPMEFYGIDSVEFYSDDAFTNLVDTYSTPAIMGPGATFYGLQPDTPFRSIFGGDP